MARFIFVYVFCVVLVCLAMQRPLADYLLNKYHVDVSGSKIFKNLYVKKFAEFYEILKIFDEKKEQRLASGDDRVVSPVADEDLDENLSEIFSKTKENKNLTRHDFSPQDQIGENPSGLNESEGSVAQISQNEQISQAAQIPPRKPQTVAAPQNLAEDKIVLKSGEEALFIGDSMMQPVAMHAKKSLSRLGIKSTDLSRHSTGLINKRYFDWQEATLEALAQNRNIKLVVVLLGANDSWGVKVDGRYKDFNSDEWADFYGGRVGEIYDAAQTAGARVIWLGAPCMRDEAFDAKMRRLNEIFKAGAKARGGRYFDTDEVVCDGGKYEAYLKDDKGKPVKARADDGIHINIKGSKIVSAQLMKQIEVLDENSTK